MATLVEIRLVREMARKDEAKIKALSEDLQKEKDHSRKQGQKIEKLLSKFFFLGRPSIVLAFASIIFLFYASSSSMHATSNERRRSFLLAGRYSR